MKEEYEKYINGILNKIENNQYWINSYSNRASNFVNDPDQYWTKSYLENIKILHSDNTKLKQLSKVTLDEWKKLTRTK
jgi:hypothetical protein